MYHDRPYQSIISYSAYAYLFPLQFYSIITTASKSLEVELLDQLLDALIEPGQVVDTVSIMSNLNVWPVILCLMLISDWQVAIKTTGYNCTEMPTAT
jgi:hypothetical protein